MKKIILVRVGADQSAGGGRWNGPVDPSTGTFVYIAIPESKNILRGHERPYLSPSILNRLQQFNVHLPDHLRNCHMHLDPDFENCTYGDQGQRAKQLRQLNHGDMIVFYAGLRSINDGKLVYGLIGQLTVDQLSPAGEIRNRDLNAHTRREPIRPDDLVVIGLPAESGRYDRCIAIGELRDKAYRVTRELLEAWGGLSVKDGYIHRSVQLPKFSHPERFLEWLAVQHVHLLNKNN